MKIIIFCQPQLLLPILNLVFPFTVFSRTDFPFIKFFDDAIAMY